MNPFLTEQPHAIAPYIILTKGNQFFLMAHLFLPRLSLMTPDAFPMM